MTAPFLAALAVHGRHCLVVGGDVEAHAKALRLHGAGASVTVAWPEADAGFAAWMASAGVRWERRAPGDGDLAARPFVVVSSVRDEALSAWLHERATREGLLHCCLDQPSYSNFSNVACADAGLVTVGLASGGAAPALLKRLRVALERGLGGDFADFTRYVAALRAATSPAERRAALDEALAGLRVELSVRLPAGWRERWARVKP